MFQKIDWKNLTPKKLELLLLAFFLLLRVLSFLTFHIPLLNSIIALGLIISFTYITIKDVSLGWTILVTELLLDGAGLFFGFATLILRTWFLGIFALIWLYHKMKDRKLELSLPKPILVTLSLSILIIFFSTMIGILNHHGIMLVLQDTLLYLFLFLLFPALEFKQFNKEYFTSLIKIFIIGSAVFALLTFFAYSSSIGILHDNFYQWFRDIVGGKITDMGHNFFRIVISNQLLVVPLIIVFASYLINDTKNKKLWFLTTLSLIIIAMNFSRIYFLALGFGLLLLVFKNNFKKWFFTCLKISFIFVLIFLSLNTFASRFQTLGLETVGVKISQIESPKTDISGSIRLAMLPDIKEKISAHPYFGSGLATKVSYIDPVTNKQVSRTQFDWGYFEMIAELGFVGTTIFLIFVLTVLYYLAKLAYKQKSPLHLGLLAGAISLFVINLTTPALFQGFGILYFVFIIKIISDNLKKDDVFLQ